MNIYILLNKLIYEEEFERILLDVLVGLKILDFEELMISKEKMNYIEDKILKVLLGLELEVFILYLDGKFY